MASTKNSPNNVFNLTSIESIKFMQSNYFDMGTNNANSYAQKLEIINLICFLTQKMQKIDSIKFSCCLDVLSKIFNVDLNDLNETGEHLNFNVNHVRSFGLICDNLLWGTIDPVPKPENFKSAKEIKDYIFKYFTEEWAPF